MTLMPARIFVCEAVVVRWVDGDTVWLNVDQLFRDFGVKDFRLLGINTPERGRPGYGEANARVRELAPPGTLVIIETRKAKPTTRSTSEDVYGRWLANLWIASTGQHVNEIMVAEGHAVPFMVGK